MYGSVTRYGPRKWLKKRSDAKEIDRWQNSAENFDTLIIGEIRDTYTSSFNPNESAGIPIPVDLWKQRGTEKRALENRIIEITLSIATQFTIKPVSKLQQN